MAITLAATLHVTPAATLTGSEAIERARSWTMAGVGYNAGGSFTNQYGTYRTDCSGYVSMALGLPTSYTTGTLESVTFPIAKDGLEPGDILNNPAPGPSGHVVLFAGWADEAQTRYFAYEQSPSGGAHLSEIPYPYWPGYGVFTPRRYNGTTSTTAPPITIPEPVERPTGPAPLTDGQFVRHDGEVYRIAGGAPVPVTAWRNFGGRQRARTLSNREFADLPTRPADGTFLRTPRPPLGRAETYVVAGGAPVFVPRGTMRRTPRAVTVEQSVIDDAGQLSPLNDQPADGTVVKTTRGQYYVFAGGAPIHMSTTWWKSLRPRPSATTVAQVALDQAGGFGAWSHVRDFPADNTLIKADADVYRIERGVPVAYSGVRGVPVDPQAIDNAGEAGPWSHLIADPTPRTGTFESQ
jgi:hypothetical protein